MSHFSDAKFAINAMFVIQKLCKIEKRTLSSPNESASMFRFGCMTIATTKFAFSHSGLHRRGQP